MEDQSEGGAGQGCELKGMGEAWTRNAWELLGVEALRLSKAENGRVEEEHGSAPDRDGRANRGDEMAKQYTDKQRRGEARMCGAAAKRSGDAESMAAAKLGRAKRRMAKETERMMRRT